MIPSQLPTFIGVVKHGSFSAASRKLGVSPAAVSKSISQLEKVLNQRLFHRSTHALTLTIEGKQLYDRTVDLVEALDENISLSLKASTEMIGEIKVNLPVHFGQTVVYPKLLEFMRLHPDVILDIHFDDRAHDLIEGGFDLGIGNRINEDSRLIARPYYDLQLLYVCSQSYIDKHGEPQTPDDLRHHHCINYRSPTTGRINPWTFVDEEKVTQLTLNSKLIVNNPNSAYLAAKSGFGITLIAQNYLEQSEGELVSVLDKYKPASAPVWLYYPTRRYMPLRVKALIDHLLGNE
ncbi:transcriptional regulator LysR family [Vibrio variabilis]|uniref:Transcriptional regulator LysR family n=1 Tax=Vibrio variabilis TaxID=990271 RepID=A0ABQ0JFT8_9VIBR|nr:transcriptional regulator LysR family [Vibrio variabilis]